MPKIFIPTVRSSGGGPPPIQGVPTNTAALLGAVERGPREPRQVTSWAEYSQIFGGHLPPEISCLSYAAEGFFANGGQRLWIVPLDGQNPPALADYEAALPTLAALPNLALVAIPDAAGLGDLDWQLARLCENRRDRFAVLSAPAGITDPASLAPPVNSSFAAFYYPWVKVPGPDGAPLLVPPTGHILGVIARTDLQKGVWKNPAPQPLEGVTGLEVNLSVNQFGDLNFRQVNCLRDIRVVAVRYTLGVWGARTTSSDPEWKYISVRRLFIFLESSISQGLQWVAFEPNNETLWANVRRTVEDFLLRLWKQGAMAGLQPEHAFFVLCGLGKTMTQDDVANGRLICEVGVAPLKPAEFSIFRILLKTG